MNNFEELINHLKAQGFIFQGSEIYGGLANSWDYGPLGTLIKHKLKKIWWDFFINKSKTNVGLDSSIILNPNVWKASGHIDNFNDPLIDCKNCKSRWRADKLIEAAFPQVDAGKMSDQELMDFIITNQIVCPNCKKMDYSNIRKFDLMFKTNQGVIEDSSTKVYLRPEIAQGIFINFKNVQRSMRLKLPFGIGQIGKSFRNEITPGNFIFRTREFEQMELEFFYDPNDKNDWFNYWVDQVQLFLTDKLGVDQNNFVLREHSQNELAHYSKRTIDIEFKFPFGVGELWGISNRGDYDLKVHEQYSNQDLKYLNPETNEKFFPYVIEPSVGVGRLLLALLVQAYHIETLADGSQRVNLRLHQNIAPYQIAVLPLQKQQIDQAQIIYDQLLVDFDVIFDKTQQIGKRYRRQDAIGTPYCLTVDFDSTSDKMVTIRERDSMKQERIAIDQLKTYFNEKFK